MKLAQNKIVVILLMLVAFVGHTTANTAMVCEHQIMDADMVMMNHTNMTNTAMADMMSMNVKQGNQANQMDCCPEQCQCPMSGCVSVSGLVNNTVHALVIAEQQIFQLSSSNQSQASTSLYRPPIS